MQMTDTEAETSVELDASLKPFVRGYDTTSANATKTVFNITFDENLLQQHESGVFRDYEKRLQQEIKDWGVVFRNSLQELERAQHKHPTVNCSLLPANKRSYLDAAPNLQMFLRDSVQFRQAANLFLEMDYAEMLEMQENLTEICGQRLSVEKANKIAENLANKSNH